MKKVCMVSMITLISFTIISCSKNKPEVNYVCSDYIAKENWDLSLNKTQDTIVLYSLNHKISVKDDFPSAVDSTKVTTILSAEKFSKLPPPIELHSMIYKSLLSSHSACKHKGTFRPYEISIGFLDNDSTISIQVDFFASNAYGTPGELRGIYLYDSKTYKLKDELVGE